jgi:hypothetical protein
MTPLPQRRSSEPGAPPRRFAVHAAMQIMMAAASLLLVAGAAWFASAARHSGWTVQSLEGTPHVAGTAIDAPVDAADRADRDHRRGLARAHRRRLDRCRGRRAEQPPAPLTSRAGEHRMALDRGGIRAIIWAPPGLVLRQHAGGDRRRSRVRVPLQVDDRGWGTVRVSSGWVAFEYKGRESFIPMDAMCATRPGFGPGTPCYEDAPAGHRRGSYDSRFLADGGRKRAPCRARHGPP